MKPWAQPFCLNLENLKNNSFGGKSKQPNPNMCDILGRQMSNVKSYGQENHYRLHDPFDGREYKQRVNLKNRSGKNLEHNPDKIQLLWTGFYLLFLVNIHFPTVNEILLTTSIAMESVLRNDFRSLGATSWASDLLHVASPCDQIPLLSEA